VAPIDAHYEALQNEMHQLFQVVGIAVN
jgi:hypothetical protein